MFFKSWLRSNNAAGVQAALTELLLLSDSNNLLLTPGSSYGEQAMAINGRPGYYVRSTVPNHARITYQALVEVGPKNCYRIHTAQPSIEKFSQTIKKATCYHPDMYNLGF